MSTELEIARAKLLEIMATEKLRNYTSPYSGDYRETLRDPEPSTHFDPRMQLTIRDMPPAPSPFIDAQGNKLPPPFYFPPKNAEI